MNWLLSVPHLRNLGIAILVVLANTGCREFPDGRRSVPSADGTESPAESRSTTETQVDNVEDSSPSARLVRAAVRGDTARVSVLLEGGTSPDAPNLAGERPLSQAVSSGSTTVAEMLLAAGAEVDAPEENGWTALMYATFRGHLPLTHLLLSAGGDPDVQFPPHRLTALDVLVSGWIREKQGIDEVVDQKETDEKRLGVLAALLEAGANPNRYGDPGPPLWLALVGVQSPELVGQLLANGAAIDDIPQGPLQGFVQRPGPMADVLLEALRAQETPHP